MSSARRVVLWETNLNEDRRYPYLNPFDARAAEVNAIVDQVNAIVDNLKASKHKCTFTKFLAYCCFLALLFSVVVFLVIIGFVRFIPRNILDVFTWPAAAAVCFTIANVLRQHLFQDVEERHWLNVLAAIQNLNASLLSKGITVDILRRPFEFVYNDEGAICWKETSSREMYPLVISRVRNQKEKEQIGTLKNELKEPRNRLMRPQDSSDFPRTDFSNRFGPHGRRFAGEPSEDETLSLEEFNKDEIHAALLMDRVAQDMSEVEIPPVSRLPGEE